MNQQILWKEKTPEIIKHSTPLFHDLYCFICMVLIHKSKLSSNQRNQSELSRDAWHTKICFLMQLFNYNLFASQILLHQYQQAL